MRHHFLREKPSELHFPAAVEDSILGLTGPFQVAGIDALLMPPSAKRCTRTADNPSNTVPFRNRIRACRRSALSRCQPGRCCSWVAAADFRSPLTKNVE